MDIGIIGMAVHPPAEAIRDARLEEIAFRTARAALADAGVERRQLDSVTLGASDELDGRSISSMLLAAPSGAYLKDEIRVTDSGMTALALTAMRVASGRFDLALVISWNQTSVGSLEDAMRMRAEPFFLRPIGMNATIADGFFAGAVAQAHGLDDGAVADLAVARQHRAALNPRGLQRPAACRTEVLGSPLRAWPLRSADTRRRSPTARSRWCSHRPAGWTAIPDTGRSRRCAQSRGAWTAMYSTPAGWALSTGSAGRSTTCSPGQGGPPANRWTWSRSKRRRPTTTPRSADAWVFSRLARSARPAAPGHRIRCSAPA